MSPGRDVRYVFFFSLSPFKTSESILTRVAAEIDGKRNNRKTPRLIVRVGKPTAVRSMW